MPSIIALLAAVLMMAQQFAGAFRENEILSLKLLRMNRLKDEFIAKTSHEFKTPLNSMINICQTLWQGREKDVRGRKEICSWSSAWDTDSPVW
ncbi:hypothetical protein PO124_29645 [Bacillus licheniformis]|nr:hypothetical protein [Bacillus licheniformis]